MTIPLGKYKHFKGSVYKVVGTAIHSETKEQMVIYKEENTTALWVRPLKMFTETIFHEGKEELRFRFIEQKIV